MKILNLEDVETAARTAGELHLEEVWDVDYDTLLSIFVAGAMWLAKEIENTQNE